MKYVLLFGLTFILAAARAQDFEKRIASHRQEYKEEFLKTPNSPLKEGDLTYLRFFEPDSTYRLRAKFVATPGSEPFAMLTYSGMRKQYVKYGELHFELAGKEQTLNVYQSLDLRKMPQYRDYLFVPFKDLTNAQKTYGGGRYLDFRMKDIEGDNCVLDFNKAYNPYCAYSEGYNCPIPPRENHLEAKVEAGEMNFGKEH
ncbi:DUF1684 domain-containing protein [Persicitalea jodogahamensis]|uniref:DUF1684 domain-containing protein n=1 Tax=Persicitalea jodogahamensis TaxID=402147 RepID=A0A8J3D4I0_9BACT|nr:DUF1684 domain-containing protein [Persicitalea jodogahamensis]GHB58643.1 hypothetical protein GCM10007390_10170 [Persicitalea jodogahamensis]